MLVGLCPPVGDPWKLAPELVVVVVGVVIVFLGVLCAWLIVVLRCIVVPVPMLTPEPAAVDMEELALI